MTTPEFINKIDWELLRQQKEFLLNHGADEAMGIAHLIDAVQDYAVELGIGEENAFGAESNNDK
jgi:hypothetical protein